MISIVWLVALWSADRMDTALFDRYIEVITAKSSGSKYQAVALSLMQIEAKRYTARQADSIALLYASLLVQDIPKLSKVEICTTLSEMKGLDSSIEGIGRFAKQFRIEAAARPQTNRLRTNELRRVMTDVEIVNDLLTALETRKAQRK